jgi:hypothetical protein
MPVFLVSANAGEHALYLLQKVLLGRHFSRAVSDHGLIADPHKGLPFILYSKLHKLEYVPDVHCILGVHY